MCQAPLSMNVKNCFGPIGRLVCGHVRPWLWGVGNHAVFFEIKDLSYLDGIGG